MAWLIAAMPMAASAQAVRDGKMRILGHATVEVVPDNVTVSVGVTNKGPSPTAALDQNSATARKIIDFAKKFGIDQRDIGTDTINLGPAYRTVRDPNGNTRQEPDGYNANNTVRVMLTDVSRVGLFMRQALDQGATTIRGLEFGLSNPEKAMDEARTKAVANAVHQAQLLATAAKVKLGAIHEIVHPPRTQIDFSRGAQAAMPRTRRMEVPVEVGTVRIAADVDITWTIE